MSTAYLPKLEVELQVPINKILEHPFLKRIALAQLTYTQLQLFVKEYAHYCAYFPRFLAAAAANIPDDATRLPIIKNLWEEHGEGQLATSHRVLFEQFAAAVGITTTKPTLSDALFSTQQCVQTLLNICKNKHFLVALGALGPGTEFFTAQEYQIIAKGLAQYECFNKKNLQFWTIHINADEMHYSEMLAAIEPWLATNYVHQQYVKEGAIQALKLECLFWDGLEAACKEM